MDIYRYFAENESVRFTFLFTYKPSKEELLTKLNSSLGYDAYIYDIFPEPNQETVCLEDILSVMTEGGKEMFIPSGLTVNYFDQVMVLFGKDDELDDELQA